MRMKNFCMSVVSTIAQITTLCVVGIGGVFAADGKLYNGSSCVSTGGGTIRYISGFVFNDSLTSSATIECPIINDSSAGVNFADIRVRDGHATQGVRCTLTSMSSMPLSTFRASTVFSLGASGTLEALRSAGVGGSAGHRYFLRCILPPRDPTTRQLSLLEQYFVEEP